MIAIIKYNAGNIRSVQNALDRLGYPSVITDDPDTIYKAEKVIFPGVGEASSAMNYLTQRGLDKVLKNVTQPMLGICLGLQLMCQYSEEGNTSCLGIFKERVSLFPAEQKVPHMGWNELEALSGDLYQQIEPNSDVYFVHSYYAQIGQETTAICNYIRPFSASLQKNNFYATQFHPEKSAGIGAQILKNFLEL